MKRSLQAVVLAGVAACAMLVAWRVAAQQPDRGAPAAWTSLPGGTPEDRLWEVLILMGAGDRDPASWNGRLQVSGGDIQALDGYRFELPDRVLPEGGWQMQTKVERVLHASPLEGGATAEQRLLPKGLLVRGAGTESTTLALQTAQGGCTVSPMRVAFGRPEKCLDGRIEIQRVPAATDLSGTRLREHDFPSIAAGEGDTLWVAWQSYHDRREELNFRRYQAGRWTRLIPVGRASEDLWRPHVATDAAGKPWLIWSEQEYGNWDIFAMPWEDNAWGARQQLSNNTLPDIEPDVARGADGTIYVVWQAMQGRYSQIRMRYLRGGRWSEVLAVTEASADDWDPAVAAAADGRVWIAWDRYRGSYDLMCRSYSPSAGFSPEAVVAGSPKFEAYATVTVDPQNRPWVAWETGGEDWGKDLGAAVPKAPGTPLGGPRSIGIACLDGDAWKTPAPPKFQDSLAVGVSSQSAPLLFTDPDGNLWMAFKRRYSRAAFRPSTYWETFLTRLDGDGWTAPVPLPDSWTRKSTRMSLAAGGGRLWAFWPSESRRYDFASRPLSNRVIAGSLPLPGRGKSPVLRAGAPSPAAPVPAEDVSAVRAYRVQVGGETLRIVRGDLHRHTELSQDIGGLDDGSLPEFYRYMIDAAAMDFGASTDHQGGGTDYWNFMTQKMADMYHFPQRFVPLYAYERNLGNPFGHRNIIYTHRNYPIVPFFQKIDARFMLPDSPDGELLTFNSMAFGSGVRNDTQLLWEEVRKTGGLSIPHTSASSSMGTDWSDGEPQVRAGGGDLPGRALQLGGARRAARRGQRREGRRRLPGGGRGMERVEEGLPAGCNCQLGPLLHAHILRHGLHPGFQPPGYLQLHRDAPHLRGHR